MHLPFLEGMPINQDVEWFVKILFHCSFQKQLNSIHSGTYKDILKIIQHFIKLVTFTVGAYFTWLLLMLQKSQNWKKKNLLAVDSLSQTIWNVLFECLTITDHI